MQHFEMILWPNHVMQQLCVPKTIIGSKSNLLEIVFDKSSTLIREVAGIVEIFDDGVVGKESKTFSLYDSFCFSTP